MKSRHTVGLLAAFAILASAGAAFAQSCITGPEASCGPAELCAPEGYAAYYWAPPGGGVQTTRCILATETGVYSVRFGTDPNNLGEPCFIKFELSGGVCEIKGPSTICKGEEGELCGPEGDFEYEWTLPSGATATTRCIPITESGDYTLKITDTTTKCECTAKKEVTIADCGVVNCPRTVGFWGAQCAQRGNGSTKFDLAHMTAIASCVDDQSDFLSWGDDFAGFCAAMSTADMNQRKQAIRQFVGMLANVCVGDLGYVASNGNVINLSTSTIVHCYGDEEMTIGELIEAIDDDLADLAGQSLEDDEVKSAYGAIITCADHINNGIGIGETCKGEVDKAGRVSGPGGEETELAVATPEVELYRPYPNPSNLMQTVRMAYSISVDQAEVNVGVYDIAGRFVKSLVRGSFGAGRYEMSWDGTDSMGNRAKSGVYFVRGSIAGQPFGSRILRLQ